MKTSLCNKEKKMKILFLCSGGDAPGMNRYIWELYSKFKKDLYFAYAGFDGLIKGKIFPLSSVIDKSLKDEAGTVTKTSRCPEFKQAKYFKMGLENAKQFDVVIVFGGNGSQKGAKQLFENGINTIFVPGTIDNDVLDCEYSIGFSTAVKEGVYAIDNSMPSNDAMDLACIYEVMGRESDRIALKVAEMVCADYCISDKKSLNLEKLKKIIEINYENQLSTCIVLRENLIDPKELTDKLNQEFQKKIVRFHIVGRTQRGGKPTEEELNMATKYAKKTVQCIKSKTYGVRLLANLDLDVETKPFI